MIHGIGIDNVAIERFQRFIDENNQALLDRLFTPGELNYCSNRKDRASCLAARFAAKEAFLKALGTGLRHGMSWLEIETFNDDAGKPYLLLSGVTEIFFKERVSGRIHLSLSHDGGNAIAMVVLET